MFVCSLVHLFKFPFVPLSLCSRLFFKWTRSKLLLTDFLISKLFSSARTKIYIIWVIGRAGTGSNFRVSGFAGSGFARTGFFGFKPGYLLRVFSRFSTIFNACFCHDFFPLHATLLPTTFFCFVYDGIVPF